MRQDYRFLIQYGRVFALAAARAPDPELLTRFTDLLWSTMRHEMDLHRRLAADLGISAHDLEREEMAPATQAYSDFLLATAAIGDFAELTAALLPCMWAYSEIGHKLDEGPRPSDPRLAAWIDSYADPEFAAQADWCRDVVDQLAQAASKELRSRMEAAFVISSRYELAFWEMAWTLDRWIQ